MLVAGKAQGASTPPTGTPIVSQTPSHSLSVVPPQCDALHGLSDGSPAHPPAIGDQADTAASSTEEQCCDAQGVHLFTIYPLGNVQGFARLSCIAVTETVTPCGQPFCVSRRELTRLLSQFLPEDRVGEILSTLHCKEEVQMTITDADARDLGFMAKVM